MLTAYFCPIIIYITNPIKIITGVTGHFYYWIIVSAHDVKLWMFSMGLFTWYRNDFHPGTSFVPEWSSFCIHMTKSRSLREIKNKDGASFAQNVIVPNYGYIGNFNEYFDHRGASWFEQRRQSPFFRAKIILWPPYAVSSRNGVRYQFTWYEN